MPVFISHSTADDALARTVYNQLHAKGITCYLDDLDRAAAAARGTTAVTTLILSRLESCSHLLAVVTTNTVRSWWVPFEVGVARRAPRAICTYTNLGLPPLPEFLREWPVLTGPSALDEFARLYRSQPITLTRDVREGVEFRAATDSVGSFHSRLKSSLGQ
jgi:hypothetical protein